MNNNGYWWNLTIVTLKIDHWTTQRKRLFYWNPSQLSPIECYEEKKFKKKNVHNIQFNCEWSIIINQTVGYTKKATLFCVDPTIEHWTVKLVCACTISTIDLIEPARINGCFNFVLLFLHSCASGTEKKSPPSLYHDYYMNTYELLVY